jgi:hypothetical protein
MLEVAVNALQLANSLISTQVVQARHREPGLAEYCRSIDTVSNTVEYVPLNAGALQTNLW